MGEFQYFDIILFAMVAGFLVLRLRSVLGRRTGNERRRDLFPRRAAPATDSAATLVEPDKRLPRPAEEAPPSANAVAEGLNRIRRPDPSFDPSHFIEGARTAFEMIIAAFAKLRPHRRVPGFCGRRNASGLRFGASAELMSHRGCYGEV
jgi:predicted lipid-binding transport protein (Tim44 family)